MTRIAVLASGRGSNFEAILGAVGKGELKAEIVALVSDQADSGAMAKARSASIRAIAVPSPQAAGAAPADRRRAHEKRILDELAPLEPGFLVMAGYMRIVTPGFIDAFRSERGYSRIVNIHPSLLPAFPGVAAYEQAFRHGAKVTGVTVHLVESGVDSGPICAQEAFGIGECRSAAEIEERGLAVEHRLYPEALKWILTEEFTVEKREGRLCVRPN